jgi:hypothetical protein
MSSADCSHAPSWPGNRHFTPSLWPALSLFVFRFDAPGPPAVHLLLSPVFSPQALDTFDSDRTRPDAQRDQKTLTDLLDQHRLTLFDRL